jgi:hypothetical protein
MKQSCFAEIVALLVVFGQSHSVFRIWPNAEC